MEKGILKLMKIYDKEINNLSNKIIWTKNIFQVLKNIMVQNKKIFILTPCTKLSEIFMIKHDSSFVNFISQQEENVASKILNEKFLVQLINNLEQKLEMNFLSIKTEYFKLLKSVVEIEDRMVKDAEIQIILRFLNDYSNGRLEIVVVGFDNLDYLKNYSNLDLYFITNEIVKKVNVGMLEMLVIHKKDEVFEVEDKDTLLSWLELQTKTVITYKDLNSYLGGVKNFNSFLIDKSLKKL